MIHISGAGGFIGQAIRRYCDGHLLPYRGYTRSVNPASGLISLSDYSEIPEGGTLIHLGEHSEIGSINENIISKQKEVALELSKKKFEKIVYASSAGVYRPSAEVIKTNSDIFSDTPYAQGKLACEETFLKANGIVARLSNVYGPGMSQKNVLGTILSQRFSKEIKVYNVTPVRDYIWVDDIAEALVKMVLSKENDIFHISTGHGTSVKDLIEISCRLSRNESFKVIESYPDGGNSLVLDPSLTKQRFSWKPQMDLETGISKLIGTL